MTTTTNSYNVEISRENVEGLIQKFEGEFPSFKGFIPSYDLDVRVPDGGCIPRYTFVKYLTALGLTTGIGLMEVQDVVEDLKTNAGITNERTTKLALLMLQMASALSAGAGEIARLEERLTKLEASSTRASQVYAEFGTEAYICDCERGHNGLGLVGRECDCHPGVRSSSHA